MKNINSFPEVEKLKRIGKKTCSLKWQKIINSSKILRGHLIKKILKMKFVYSYGIPIY